MPNPLFIGASYIPPEYSVRKNCIKVDYYKELTNSLANYTQKGNVIIAGDLNSRTGNYGSHEIEIPGYEPFGDNKATIENRLSCDFKVNNYGKKLNMMCKEFDLVIANGRTPGDRIGNFTCHTSRGDSVVDYFISDNEFFNRLKQLVIHEPTFGSVHSPMSLTIDCSFENTLTKRPPIPPPPKFIWDPEKRDQFIEVLKLKLGKFSEMSKTLSENNCTEEGTAIILKEFTDTLYDSANSCFKMVNKTRKIAKKGNHKEQSKPWYNDSCLSLKKRLLNQSRLLKKNPKDPYIRGAFILCRKKYRKIIKANKISFETDKLEEMQSLTKDPKKFWKKLKGILKRAGSRADNSISAESWVGHFSGLNRNNPEIVENNTDRCEFIKTKLNELDQNTEETSCSIMDTQFSVLEILSGIKSLKKGKAGALDAISNDILHCVANTGAVLVLQAIFNNLIKFQLSPKQWATGIIVPLHKSGELDDPNNYRGITLNSCISKLFTLLINNRLYAWCEEREIIHYNQIGFRKGFRTADHVFTLKTLIDDAFRNKQKLYTCFVDFKKAYDTVWRRGLFYKLLANGVGKKFVNLLKNMYSELQLCVSLSDGLSLPFRSTVGLKQGCNLSPLLFNIFINEIPEIINSSNSDPPMLANMPVSSLLYADDLVLVSKSKIGLQNAINALNGFSRDWFLEINETKTKCLVFSKGRQSVCSEFTIGDKELSFCNEYCYLGVMFSKTGSLKAAASALNDKATAAMFSLINNLYRHRSVKPRIMLDLFDKMITPIALYGVEVWGVNFVPINKENNDCFDKKHLSKHLTENLQYRFLKLLLGVPRKTSSWAVSTEFGRYPMMVKAFTLMCKYHSHLSETSSPILKAALEQSVLLAGINVNSWFSVFSRVLEFGKLNFQDIKNSSVEDKFKSIFVKKWEAEKECFQIDGGKLYILSKCKDMFSMSYYLSSSNICYPFKRALARIRTSAHKLPIETERYTNTPREERICSLGCNAIGDEKHFLFECGHPALKEIYVPVLLKLSKKMNDFNTLNLQEKLFNTMSSRDDDLLKLLGKLCHKVLNRYKEITW